MEHGAGVSIPNAEGRHVAAATRDAARLARAPARAAVREARLQVHARAAAEGQLRRAGRVWCDHNILRRRDIDHRGRIGRGGDIRRDEHVGRRCDVRCIEGDLYVG